MKNRGSTPILTNLTNPCSGLREEVEKLKKFTPTTMTMTTTDTA